MGRRDVEQQRRRDKETSDNSRLSRMNILKGKMSWKADSGHAPIAMPFSAVAQSGAVVAILIPKEQSVIPNCDDSTRFALLNMKTDASSTY